MVFSHSFCTGGRRSVSIGVTTAICPSPSTSAEIREVSSLLDNLERMVKASIFEEEVMPAVLGKCASFQMSQGSEMQRVKEFRRSLNGGKGRGKV